MSKTRNPYFLWEDEQETQVQQIVDVLDKAKQKGASVADRQKAFSQVFGNQWLSPKSIDSASQTMSDRMQESVAEGIKTQPINQNLTPPIAQPPQQIAQSDTITQISEEGRKAIEDVSRQTERGRGLLGVQRQSIEGRFKNAPQILENVKKIDELSRAGRSLTEIADEINFTPAQVSDYLRGEYFDAVLTDDERARVTEDINVVSSRLEEDFQTQKQRLNENIAKLKQDYNRNVNIQQRMLDMQEANLSKSLGLTGAGYSSSGIAGIKEFYRQSQEFLDQVERDYMATNRNLDNSLFDLTRAFQRDSEDIAKQTRDAIQWVTNQALAQIQELKAKDEDLTISGAEKIKQIKNQTVQRIEDQYRFEAEQQRELLSYIREQQSIFQQNLERVQQQEQDIINSYKVSGLSMTPSKIIEDMNAGLITPGAARTAVEQLVVATVNTLDERTGDMALGTVNFDKIRQEIAKNKTPAQVISEFMARPDVQQSIRTPEEFEFIKGTARQPGGVFNPKTGEFRALSGGSLPATPSRTQIRSVLQGNVTPPAVWYEPIPPEQQVQGYDPNLVSYYKQAQDRLVLKEVQDFFGIDPKNFLQQANNWKKQSLEQDFEPFFQAIERLKNREKYPGRAALVSVQTPVVGSIAKTISPAVSDYMTDFNFIRDNLTLQALVDLKEQGATFGALSDNELRAIGSSASPLSIYMSEERFMKTIEDIEKEIKKALKTPISASNTAQSEDQRMMMERPDGKTLSDLFAS